MKTTSTPRHFENIKRTCIEKINRGDGETREICTITCHYSLNWNRNIYVYIMLHYFDNFDRKVK